MVRAKQPVAIGMENKILDIIIYLLKNDKCWSVQPRLVLQGRN